jgi:cell division septal protein FtsQ
MEPRRRKGGREKASKIKEASNYKRAFNPTSVFSINIFKSKKPVKIVQYSVISVLVIGFYFFVVSSYFEVTAATISGNRQIPTEQIEEVLGASGKSRFFLIKKNNFFLMSRGRVNELLTTSIPTIKEVVHYNRSWPNKASIEIVEHTPGLVIESDGLFFLVNDEGEVVSQIEDPGKLLMVRDQLVENFERGENLKMALFVLSMNKNWNTKMTAAIDYVKFPGKSSNDVQFVTKAGWAVLFDTTRPMTVQLSSLAVILSKQIGPAQQANLAYIDLRLSKWAYYCFKESPCQQKEQPQASGTETNVE